MTDFFITAVFTDDTQSGFSIPAESAKEAVDIFKSMFDNILRIEHVAIDCDIFIEQPEFHIENEFTMDDVNTEITDYKDQYVLRKVSDMRYIRCGEYRTAKYQLVKALGGFGCDPTKIGTAVYVIDTDGEDYRLERYSIMGVAKPEAIEKWRQMYGEFNF